MKVEVTYNKIEVHNAAVYLFEHNPAVKENGDTVYTLKQQIIRDIGRAVEIHQRSSNDGDPTLIETYGYLVMVTESYWTNGRYFSADVLVHTSFRDELTASETLWVEKDDGLAIPT